MTESQGTALAEADPFEDAIQATAYIATVHVQYGELVIPKRVREHVADGPVVVHLVRGQDDEAAIKATLTAGSKLTGIVWPEDVKPGTTVTVMCPRGAATHDVAVLLPDLPEPLHFAYAEDDRAATPVDPIELMEISEADREVVDDGICELCPGLAVDDPEGLGLCRQHLAERDQAELDADYAEPDDEDDEEPDDVAVSGLLALDELPADDPWAGPPVWPGDEEVTAQEETDLLPIVVPDDVHEPEPGTVYAVVVAEAAPKPQRHWMSRIVDAVAATIRFSARWEEEHALTIARITVASLSLAVLAGVGVLAALGVTR